MMSRKKYVLLRISLTLLFSLIPAFSGTGTAEENFDFSEYASVLKTYVNEKGMVDYKSLKAHREELDSFTGSLSALGKPEYEQWTEDEQIAFWLNSYNSLTLQVIIDHYPIKPNLLASVLYPKNSIRQIRGVWDEIRFPVMGKRMTLGEMEDGILRVRFNEPRIHMALVCAAMGCPPLRTEPYLGERLDAQLEDQTNRFLSDPRKFRIDTVKDTVYLSPIFNWFGTDFIKRYGTKEKYAKFSEPERAVLNFISQHLDETDAHYLDEGGYRIRYLDYDWSLNEQR